MVKINKIMIQLGRFFLLVILLNTFVYSNSIILNKATIEKGELCLSFSKSLRKNDIKHYTLKNPYREIYDFENTRIAHYRVPLGLGSNVRMAQNKANSVRVVIESSNAYKSKAYQSLLGDMYYIGLPKNTNILPANRYEKPQTAVQKPQARIFRKNELIVIDAGHGGHDSGAICGGKKEKDLALQIAIKLEKQLLKQGYLVHMTRKKDIFLKLPERTKIADKKNAAVFVSVHANSVPKSKQNKVHGVETFFLQHTRDERSQRIAERENKSVLKGTNQLSRNVILDSVLSGPKIVQSNKLAIDVHRRIMTNLHSKYGGVKDGGVRSAPFWVLVGASRPSVLVEMGYISHPNERKRLFMPRYQDLIVNGIAEGIENYLNNRKQEIDL